MSSSEFRRKRLSSTKRQEIFDKTRGHCAYCGEKLELKDMQVDHIVALRLGGDDDISNMLPACRSCNHYKRGNSLEGFRKMVENQPNVLLRDSVGYRIALRFGMVWPNPHPVAFYFELDEDNKHEK